MRPWERGPLISSLHLHTCRRPMCLKPKSAKAGTSVPSRGTAVGGGDRAHLRWQSSWSTLPSDRVCYIGESLIQSLISQREQSIPTIFIKPMHFEPQVMVLEVKSKFGGLFWLRVSLVVSSGSVWPTLIPHRLVMTLFSWWQVGCLDKILTNGPSILRK